MNLDRKKLLKEIVLILSGFWLVTFIDASVVDWTLKPLNEHYNVPWKAFETDSLGRTMLHWHLSYAKLVIVLFALLAYARGKWQLAVRGYILCLFGPEDIFYYWITGAAIPAELPWLDNVFAGWTLVFMPGQHVSKAGLLISSILSILLVTAWILKDHSRPREQIV